MKKKIVQFVNYHEEIKWGRRRKIKTTAIERTFRSKKSY